MRRVRLPVGRGLFFAAAFLFALVALVPLRLGIDWLGLDRKGLAAREASGSVWLGALSEARFGPVVVGDVGARLRTLPLLLGRARVDVGRSDEARPLEGGVTVTRHGFGIDDVTARLELEGLPVAALDLADLSVRFSGGLCRSAEGRVKAEVAGAALAGQARCDGGALRLPLTSSGGASLDLSLTEDGRYRGTLTAGGASSALEGRF